VDAGILSNVTCTAAAANSKALDLQTGGASIFSLTYTGSNCANPLMLVPTGAGLTAGTAAGIGYDTTNGAFHPAVNGADSLMMNETAGIAANTILKSANNTRGTASGSSMTDNGTTIASTETLTIGTAAGSPAIIDKTIGVTTSAMSTQATNAAVNITGMTWTVANSKNYLLRCEIPMTLTSTATLAFSLANSSGNAATSYSLDAQGGIGAAGVWAESSTLAQTAWGTKTTTTAAFAGTTVIKVWAQIQDASNSGGTLTLQTWDVAASGTIQVLANASCTLTQEN
jgi:hypothetical protein